MLTRRGLLRRSATSEIPQETCTICLDNFNVETIRGQLPCNHSLFCLQCILGWAEVTNKCPICVSRFSFITPCLSNGSIAPNTTPFDIEHREQDEDLDYSDSDSEEICNVCENDIDGAILLVCERCNDAFHLNCMCMVDLPDLDS